MELALKSIWERLGIKQKKPLFNETRQLAADIKDTRMRLEAARSRFEFAMDEAEIEASIYEMESLNVQYRRLLRQARDCHLCCDPTDNW